MCAYVFPIVWCQVIGLLSCRQSVCDNNYQSVTIIVTIIDAPEPGRANQGQGNNTSSGREDYIDKSRQGAK